VVLVVDDSAAIRAFIRTVLEQAGYEVQEAENAASASEALDGVDVALIDVELGRESGFDLAAGIGIPVVLVSGHDLPGCHYLRKPFTPDALLSAVRSCTVL
jgi:DNA-binding response OmpR family regulator